MRRNIRDRQITFNHQDGCLVRTVTGAPNVTGAVRIYTHRCELEVFEKVAHAMEETPAEGEGTTMPAIVAAENLPFTQVDVALAFLHERGIVERRHRRNYPASRNVHLDAMVEWHALREEPKTA
ncbi:MAG: hypothetical protein SH850_28715 [Planctomycetaceae bacterium]|nr:hypothetical protein [Planctomycetaceae bacterium]